MEMVEKAPSGGEIMTVKQLAEHPRYRWLTESALRHMIFEASPRFNSKGEKVAGNGMLESGCLVRLGRRVLVDVERFDAWLLSH